MPEGVKWDRKALSLRERQVSLLLCPAHDRPGLPPRPLTLTRPWVGQLDLAIDADRRVGQSTGQGIVSVIAQTTVRPVVVRVQRSLRRRLCTGQPIGCEDQPRELLRSSGMPWMVR